MLEIWVGCMAGRDHLLGRGCLLEKRRLCFLTFVPGIQLALDLGIEIGFWECTLMPSARPAGAAFRFPRTEEPHLLQNYICEFIRMLLVEDI